MLVRCDSCNILLYDEPRLVHYDHKDREVYYDKDGTIRCVSCHNRFMFYHPWLSNIQDYVNVLMRIRQVPHDERCATCKKMAQAIKEHSQLSDFAIYMGMASEEVNINE